METLSRQEREMMATLLESLREATLNIRCEDRLRLIADIHDGGKRLVKVAVTRERLMG
jgi:translation initiation factor IF-1